MRDLRIYVACLASYNNGVLHGAWIDCDGLDEDEIMDEVKSRVLLTSPYPNVAVKHLETGEQVPSAEEWAIHDTGGFGNLIGEYAGFDIVAELAEYLADASNDDEQDDRLLAVRYLVEDGGYPLSAAIAKAPDVYVSDQEPEDWAYEHVSETLDKGIDGLPRIISGNIDWDGVFRDLELEGVVSKFDGYLIEDRS